MSYLQQKCHLAVIMKSHMWPVLFTFSLQDFALISGIECTSWVEIRKMPLSCRFYEHRFPEVEDVLMVNVRSIAEMGAYVHLLEYNNIEGMILLSELSRRRIRSINKLIRVGRSECVVVIRVDKDKGSLLLSSNNLNQINFKHCSGCSMCVL